MRRFSLCFCLLIALPGLLVAQKEIVDQENAWLMYIGNHRVTKTWGIHTEYQFRRADIFKEWQQSLLRFGVDYHTQSGEQFSLGFAWIKSFPYGEYPAAHDYTEHRIWQQFITKSKFHRIELQHRYRLEQRFVENWIHSNDGLYSLSGFQYLQRFRYRLQLAVPINKKELSDNTLFFIANDEVFLGFGKGIGKNILDQNRLYCALGWRFNQACNLQMGYLNQLIVKRDGIHIERNHTFQTTITYNFDWRRDD